MGLQIEDQIADRGRATDAALAVRPLARPESEDRIRLEELRVLHHEGPDTDLGALLVVVDDEDQVDRQRAGRPP